MAAPIPFSRQEPDVSAEQHHSVGHYAKLWDMSAKVLRPVFEDEPDVMKLGSSTSTGRKRRYLSLRVPESVAARVHARLCR